MDGVQTAQTTYPAETTDIPSGGAGLTDEWVAPVTVTLQKGENASVSVAGTQPGSLPSAPPAGNANDPVASLSANGTTDAARAANELGISEYDGGVISDGNAGAVRSETNTANSAEAGDPVMVATGQFTTTTTDLLLKAGDIRFPISRSHRTGLGVEGSLGDGWWFSADTMIVLGESRGASDVIATITAQLLNLTGPNGSRSKVADNYSTTYALLTSQLENANVELSRAAQSVSALESFSYSGPLASEINKKAADLLATARSKKAGWQAYVDALRSARDVDLLAYKTAQDRAIDDAVDLLNDRLVVWRAEEERAAAHTERNDRFAPAGPFPYARGAGNETVTLVDTNGVPRLYRFASAPDYESATLYADGARSFYPAGAALEPATRTSDELFLLPDGTFRLERRDRTIWYYGYNGQLNRIEDKNGAWISFSYTAERLVTIRTSRGHTVTLARDAAHRVEQINADGEIEIIYSYDSEGRLESVTDEVGDTVGFDYEGTGGGVRLTKIEKPDGSAIDFVFEWIRGRWRATSTVDEEGNPEFFDYSVAGRTRYTSPSGLVTVHWFNAESRETRTEHPGGYVERFDYNEAGDRTWHQATDGTETRFDWDERHNLLRVEYEDGTSESWSYNALDLPEDYIDRAGAYTDYTYDGRGNLIRVDYPDGSEDVFIYMSSGAAVGQVDTHTTRLGNRIEYLYDTRGYLREIRDDVGLVARYVNDEWGRPLEVTNGAGETTLYTYRADGRVDTVQGPQGLFVDYTYDNRKDLVHVVENGRPTSFVYDDRHLLERIENALGERVVYDYRADGKMREKVLQSAPGLGGSGPDGRQESHTEYLYNERGMLEAEVQIETGIRTGYLYDDGGRVSVVTDPAGTITEIDYRFDGLPISRTQILDGRRITEQYEYAPDGRITRHIDPTDVERTWNHDRSANQKTIRDGLARVVRVIEENPYGQTLVNTDGDGVERSYTYDPRGRLEELRVDGRLTARYSYDLADRVDAYTDGAGATWSYEYDPRGRLVAIVNPDTSRRGIGYNVDGTVSYERDETGLVTGFEYDAIGRMIERHDPVPESGPNATPRVTEYEWHYTGALRGVTDSTNRRQSYTIDAAGRVTAVTDPAGNQTIYGLDPAGRLLVQTDPTGRTESYGYDDLGRLVERQVGGQVTAAYAYDDSGRLLSETDGTGRAHRYEYDELGQLWRERNRAGAPKTYDYTVAGRLHRVTDFTGIDAVYSYDREGRVTGLTYSDGSFLSYKQDAAGRVVEQRNESETTVYRFDARGRLTAATGLVTGMNLVYEYDLAGRRVLRTDHAAQTATRYRYDERGLLAEIEDTLAGVTSFDYDRAGRRTLTSAPNGVRTSVRYDSAGRVSATVVRDGGGSIVHGLAHVYDQAGRRSYDITADGLVTGYQYNDQGRLAQVQYPFAGPKRESDYERFAEHGVVRALPAGTTPAPSHAAPGGTTFQDYLDVNPAAADGLLAAYREIHGLSKAQPQLYQQVWTEKFTYDQAGNRQEWQTGWGKVTYTYDTAGRLEQAGATTYDYDMAGNLTERRSSTGSTSYHYTAQHRLAAAETPEALVGYAYDAAGRRIMRTEIGRAGGDAGAEGGVPEPGSRPLQKRPNSAGAHRTVYRHDGSSRMVSSRVELELAGVADVEGLVKPTREAGGRYRPAPSAGLSGGASATSRQTFAEVTLARRTLSVTGPQGSRYLSHDVLGSVRVATTFDGQVADTYEYDAYGETLSGETSHSQPYGYNGKPQDRITGLYDYGFRDYLPEAGRFVTVDPIKDGVNWYAYVNADPVNFVDAWGLDSLHARFNKATEQLDVLVFETNQGGYFTGTVTQKTFSATNRVRTPEDRKHVPVEFGDYYMFPVEFPDGTYELGRSGTSTNKHIGPICVPTNATRDVPTYEENIFGEWVATGEIKQNQGGYLMHSGVGDTTWGCIKMCDADVAEFAGMVDEVLDSGGDALLTVGTWEKED